MDVTTRNRSTSTSVATTNGEWLLGPVEMNLLKKRILHTSYQARQVASLKGLSKLVWRHVVGVNDGYYRSLQKGLSGLVSTRG